MPSDNQNNVRYIAEAQKHLNHIQNEKAVEGFEKQRILQERERSTPQSDQVKTSQDSLAALTEEIRFHEAELKRKQREIDQKLRRISDEMISTEQREALSYKPIKSNDMAKSHQLKAEKPAQAAAIASAAVEVAEARVSVAQSEPSNLPPNNAKIPRTKPKMPPPAGAKIPRTKKSVEEQQPSVEQIARAPSAEIQKELPTVQQANLAMPLAPQEELPVNLAASGNMSPSNGPPSNAKIPRTKPKMPPPSGANIPASNGHHAVNPEALTHAHAIQDLTASFDLNSFFSAVPSRPEPVAGPDGMMPPPMKSEIPRTKPKMPPPSGAKIPRSKPAATA